MKVFSALLPVLFCLVYLQGRCQGNWKPLKDKDGIRISSRTSTRSAFNDVRVQMDLPGNARDVVAAVMNVGAYRNWAYATRNTYAVTRANDSVLIYYAEIVAPWPVSNRDLYAAISVHKDSLSGKVRIICSGMPQFAAERNHLVRIPFSKGCWDLTELSPNRVRLDYILEINPGGNIPAWVMNLFLAKGPYETFSQLRALLQQNKKG